MSTHYLNLDWPTLHRDCRALAGQLLDAGNWSGVVGIARGGLIPAAILAREMNIRLVDTLCISSYDDTRQGELNVLKGMEHDGDGLLLVDDLVDSGNTARVACDLLPKATFAAIYAKPAARELAHYYAHDIGQDAWINFPWDLDEAQQFIHPMAGAE